MTQFRIIMTGLMLIAYSNNFQAQVIKEMDKRECRNLNILVQTINEEATMLHPDYTPSVQQLCECGIPAIKAVLPLLNSSDNWERIRAQRVIEGVIKRINGWQQGSGYPQGSKGQESTFALLKLNGNFQYSDPIEKRMQSIEKWKKWLRDNEQKTEHQKQ